VQGGVPIIEHQFCLVRTEPANGIAPYAFMGSFLLLIGGGTADIQRNVIAERCLGVPR
jgi:hypothetical protein